MPVGTIILLLIHLLGGLAFFIYGMKIVSEGLQNIAGNRLRDLLFKLTKSKLAGIGIGTTLGFSIHSGAATILLVTFINAGMLTLEASVPVMLGANIGTTLSMQLVSFKVGKYALAAVAAGIFIKLAGGRKRWASWGLVVLGFGLIFLGMHTMSDALLPFKNGGYLERWLAPIDGTTPLGFLLAFVVSVAATVAMQSSGATIGVLFALASAGVFPDVAHVFPMILGAHVGTCSATLIGAVGTNIEARRSAVSHLVFNLLGVALATAMWPLYMWLIPRTSSDIVRQIANTHTIVQTVNAFLLLPFSRPFARFVRRLTPSSEPPPEKSHLDESLLDTPERAIAAAMRETRRMAILTRTMLVQSIRGLVFQTTRPFDKVLKTESVVDTLKRSINAYLVSIADRRLSIRQSVMLQHLMVTAADLERIGDHIENIVETTAQKFDRKVWFDTESMELLMQQYHRVDQLLRLVVLSLDPDLRAFKQVSARMLALRRESVQATRAMRKRYRQRFFNREEAPINGIYFERYLRLFEGIVRHTKSIARVEQEDLFALKPKKFDRRSSVLPQEASSERIPVEVVDEWLDERIRFDDLGLEPSLLARLDEKWEFKRSPKPSAEPGSPDSPDESSSRASSSD